MSFRESLQTRYEAYVTGYRAYARMRGFTTEIFRVDRFLGL